MTKQQVIDILTPIAHDLRSKHEWLQGKVSLLIAQVICESGWLKHSPGNNCLGIKWTSKYPESRKQMLWTYEYIGGKYVKVKAPFVIFDSLKDCIEQGYIRILNLSRYKETRNSIDWWDATNYIRINGYATSPTYTKTLRTIIIKNKIYEADWYRGYNSKIAEHFKWGETFSSVRFGRRTYRRVIEPPSEHWERIKKLAEQLQKGRYQINKPFTITSWYRIRDYNSYVGGADRSQHLISNAADVRVPRGYTSFGFYKVMDSITDCTGYGIDRRNRYNHFDKKNVDKRKWYY